MQFTHHQRSNTVPLDEAVDQTSKSEQTLEEMEAEMAAATPAVVVDESIPEELRGLDAVELAKQLKNSREAFKEAEQARIEAVARAAATAVAQPVAAPAPVTQPLNPLFQRTALDDITDEQIKALVMSDDPEERWKGVELKTQKSQLMMARAAEQRFQGFTTSNASSAEQLARREFAEDFEVLGAEIQEVAKLAGAQNLTTIEQWKMVVQQARGMGFDKLFAAKQAKANAAAQAAAQAQAVNGVPFVPPASASPSQVVGAIRPADYGNLDETSRKHARKQFPVGTKLANGGVVKNDADSFAAYAQLMA